MGRNFRIGVLGGMGPEAGVLMQLLIIRETPAEKDQDHIEVVAYTNPHVPDRTESLEADGGESYLKAVKESLGLLESAGVDVLVMACNTAHARLAEIQESVKSPVLDMVGLARKEIGGTDGVVGILATDGTLASELFRIPGHPEKTMEPGGEAQREVMAVIHDIKRGVRDETIVGRLEGVCSGLLAAGCAKLVLGCTELSIYADEFREHFGDIFIDPMRLAAQALVRMAKQDMSGAIAKDRRFSRVSGRRREK